MSKPKLPAKNYLAGLRNVGIIAHIDAGKTTLTERILYYTKKIHRMGEVHDGAATMDYLPEEQERGITITSACTACLWKEYRINIIDTPGHVDFTIEVQRALRVLDGAVGVFCGVAGVEPQSETVWRQSEQYKVPKLAFVNKMDRLGADFENVVADLTAKLRVTPLILTYPEGQGQEFRGVYDVLAAKRLVFDQESSGETYETEELTDEEAELLGPVREKTLETLAENDDEFLDLYLSGGEITMAQLRAAVRRATLALKVTPLFAGSALKNIGVQPLLDAMADFLPSPADVPPIQGLDPASKEKKLVPPDPKGDLAALCFKVSMDTGRKLVLMRVYSGVLEAGQTVVNVTQEKEERVARLFHLHAGRKEKIDVAFAGDIVAAAGMRFAKTGDTLALPGAPILLESIAGYKTVISQALEPKNSGEGDRLEEVLGHYLLEDPTLSLDRDEDTGQLILSGMGELHLEVYLDRLKREYNLEPRSGNPQVVYQETVSKSARAEAEFDRELGDVPHYGFVALSVEPRARDKGLDIVFECDVTAWSEAVVTAVEEGLRDGLQSGVVKGYPVVDVRVNVLDLRAEGQKGSPVGFRMAASMALKKGLSEAGPVLLEPIMWVEVHVPEEFVGDVISLLGQKNAKVENMFDRPGEKVVQALAPLRRLFGFTTELRSATQGRAGSVMKFSRFDVFA